MLHRRVVSFSALLASAFYLAGCANQLPQRSEQEARTERKLVDHSLHIDVGEPRTLEQAQRRIRVRDQKTFEVTDIEVTRRYDRYTPYQPWRELYEIPLGALAVVAGISANVLNVPALGRIPEVATRDWINYGFAGLNPLINVESNGRSQQNLASLQEVPSAPRMEYISLPWAESPVQVTAAGERYELTTDRNGVLRLNLLDGPLGEQDLARVDRLGFEVTDPQDGTRASASLGLSADLRQRVAQAHDLIFDDLEGDDVDRWVERVERLAGLGFAEEASELEQSLIELTRNDQELQQEFLRNLERRTGRKPSDTGEDG